jgi:hypothetical protein
VKRRRGSGACSVSGSVTVFLVLSLTLFLSAVFAFLELARVSSLKSGAELCTMQAADGLLAEYHPGLWKDYGILCREAESGQPAGVASLAERQKMFIAGNYEESGNTVRNYYMMKLRMADVKVSRYELITDNGGAPFRRQAVLQTKQTMPKKTVEQLGKLLNSKAFQGKSAAEIQNMEQEADQTLRRIKDQQKGASGSKSADHKKSADSKQKIPAVSEAEGKRLLRDNPITWMKKMKKHGILALVMPDQEISQKMIQTETLVSHRGRSSGNYGQSDGSQMLDRMQFRIYLKQNFPAASAVTGKGVLDYEMEYILSGKASDEKNLKSVVRQLLLMREGINYVFLLRDSKRLAQAQSLALAIASAAMLPVLEEPVKHGILLAWAYAESISDVRTLLSGGKIAPIKTAADWKTELYQIGGRSSAAVGTSDRKTKQTDAAGDSGWNRKMDYSQFLFLLLWMKKDEVITYRCMDLIECREQVKMDHMVSRMKEHFVYEAQPVFWEYVWIGQNSPGTYKFRNQRELSYLS